MKIAVDAMGGDYAPGVVMQAVSELLQEDRDKNIEIVLVGHLEKLSYYIEKYGLKPSPRLEFVHAETVVEMADLSTASIRSKKNSSITVCAGLVAESRAAGVVSAGHTGAAVAASTVKMRMAKGVDRPCIATVMPRAGGKGNWILADAGANTDCNPMNLAQFAVMGEMYAKVALGRENPTIGLLSVGGEDCKGNDLTKEAFKILSKMPINFIGNVEGHDTFTGDCDVVICDGFVGNTVLKSSESLAKATVQWLKEAFTRNAVRKAGALLAKEAFAELKKHGDFEEYGGAPLIGLNGVCIIGHGVSSPKAIKNAIRVAHTFVEQKVPEVVSSRIYECGVEKAAFAAYLHS
ncbi:MAG: phosphate acyltransferase PlsX [Lentisphaeria bacterium]|nr:phosphate acyltransferase PlsX [Lentisphaeria bacterium]